MQDLRMNRHSGRALVGDSVIVDDTAYPVATSVQVAVPVALGIWSVIVGTRSVEVTLDVRTHEALADGEEVEAYIDGTVRRVRFDDARRRVAGASIAGATGGTHVVNVVAPMPGRVIDVKVAVGDAVARGDSVAVIEAMKMESMIFAPHGGTVVAVHVSSGSVVTTRQALLRIEG
jgi:biotin carboxyl carrier protein